MVSPLFWATLREGEEGVVDEFFARKIFGTAPDVAHEHFAYYRQEISKAVRQSNPLAEGGLYNIEKLMRILTRFELLEERYVEEYFEGNANEMREFHEKIQSGEIALTSEEERTREVAEPEQPVSREKEIEGIRATLSKLTRDCVELPTGSIVYMATVYTPYAQGKIRQLKKLDENIRSNLTLQEQKSIDLLPLSDS